VLPSWSCRAHTSCPLPCPHSSKGAAQLALPRSHELPLPRPHSAHLGLGVDSDVAQEGLLLDLKHLALLLCQARRLPCCGVALCWHKGHGGGRTVLQGGQGGRAEHMGTAEPHMHTAFVSTRGQHTSLAPVGPWTACKARVAGISVAGRWWATRSVPQASHLAHTCTRMRTLRASFTASRFLGSPRKPSYSACAQQEAHGSEGVWLGWCLVMKGRPPHTLNNLANRAPTILRLGQLLGAVTLRCVGGAG